MKRMCSVCMNVSTRVNWKAWLFHALLRSLPVWSCIHAIRGKKTERFGCSAIYFPYKHIYLTLIGCRTLIGKCDSIEMRYTFASNEFSWMCLYWRNIYVCNAFGIRFWFTANFPFKSRIRNDLFTNGNNCWK